MNLEQDLKIMIVTELNLQDISPDSIADDTPLFADGLGLDSLDAVELVVLLQKKYKVEIRDMEDAQKAFVNIKTLADTIRERSEGQ